MEDKSKTGANEIAEENLLDVTGGTGDGALSSGPVAEPLIIRPKP